jgi:hypothetical protein
MQNVHGSLLMGEVLTTGSLGCPVKQAGAMVAGREIMERWLAGTDHTVAPICPAMHSCTAGGKAWSCVVCTYQLGLSREAACPALKLALAMGCCTAANSRAPV